MEPGARHPVYPEFFARGTSSVWVLRDADGRPFGEINIPEPFKAGVEFEVRKCPYPHSRKGREINISALRQLTHSWETILTYVARLRSEYMQYFGGKPDVWWLWQFGVCGSALPGYLVARGVPSTALPGAFGGMFKATQGIYMTPALLIERGLRALDTPMSADEFVELTEHHKLFIGPTGAACAGPPHMVRAFVETAINGRDTNGSDALAELVGDFPRFWEYGRAVMCQVLLWWVLDAHCERALNRLGARCANRTGAAAEYGTKFVTTRLKNMFGQGDPARLDGWIERSKQRFTEATGFVIADHKPSAAQIEAIAALVRHGSSPLASDPDLVEAWVEAFVSYVLLERELLVWFNELERRIEQTTEQSRKPPLDPTHVAAADHKNLRTMLRATLGVTLAVAGDRVTVSAGDRSVTI